MIQGLIYADYSSNGGNVTRFIGRQLSTGAIINTAVSATTWTVSRIIPGAEHQSFDPIQIAKDTFTGFDIADSGTDAITEAIFNKYKIGALKELVIKVVAPSLFDVTIKDGVEVVAWNKDGKKLLSDLVSNLITEEIDITIDKGKNVFSSVRLDSSTQASILTEFIIKGFESTLNKLQNSYNKETDPEIEDLKFISPMNYDIKN